jgi:hypothetical protein
MREILVISLQVIFLASAVVWVVSWVIYSNKAKALKGLIVNSNNAKSYKLAAIPFLLALAVWLFGLGMSENDATINFDIILAFTNITFLVSVIYIVQKSFKQI